jgi:uncharacterized phage protein (TIGR01671 family)
MKFFANSLKFRFWDLENKKMIYPDNALISNNGDIYIIKKGGMDKIKNCMVMVSTGTKDVDGREIYEGDIVQYVSPLMKEVTKKIGVVKWSRQHCGFRVFYEDGEDCFIDSDRVIGNIFENELKNSPKLKISDADTLEGVEALIEAYVNITKLNKQEVIQELKKVVKESTDDEEENNKCLNCANSVPDIEYIKYIIRDKNFRLRLCGLEGTECRFVDLTKELRKYIKTIKKED